MSVARPLVCIFIVASLAGRWAGASDEGRADPDPEGRITRSYSQPVDRAVEATLGGVWTVSGVVLREDSSGPAADVDLDFLDLVTGDVVSTPGDTTNAAGAYSVVVPEGIYEVSFDGPRSGPADPPLLAHGRLQEVSVDRDLTLPTMTLAPGYRLRGEVRDAGLSAVEGARLTLRDPTTGERIFTKNDRTTLLGRFNTIVPAGTYDIEIHPPAGLALASKALPGVAVVFDTFLGTQLLEPGLPVSGSVGDPDAVPLREVDLDVASSSTGDPVPLAFDRTDSSGQYLLHLPPGTYDIGYWAVLDSHVDPAVRPSVDVAAATTVPLVELPFHNDDNDPIVDVADDCPFTTDPFQEDFDGDGVGSLCDNCPIFANPRQEDNDLDGPGDICDPNDDNDQFADFIDADRDGDDVVNWEDNCPDAWNPSQEDLDANDLGDACDPDDGLVEFLRARNARAFEWRPENGVLGYQVYRQRLAWLSNLNLGLCAHDTPGNRPFLVNDDAPTPGQGFGYLVTAEMPAGEGPLGRRSDGGVRPNLRSCP